MHERRGSGDDCTPSHTERGIWAETTPFTRKDKSARLLETFADSPAERAEGDSDERPSDRWSTRTRASGGEAQTDRGVACVDSRRRRDHRAQTRWIVACRKGRQTQDNVSSSQHSQEPLHRSRTALLVRKAPRSKQGSGRQQNPDSDRGTQCAKPERMTRSIGVDSVPPKHQRP